MQPELRGRLAGTPKVGVRCSQPRRREIKLVPENGHSLDKVLRSFVGQGAKTWNAVRQQELAWRSAGGLVDEGGPGLLRAGLLRADLRSAGVFP